MTISTPDPGLKRGWRSPSVLLATWGGMGFSPRAPGTVGSLGALPLIYASHWLPFAVALLGAACLLVLGALVSDRLEARWGCHDPGAIVIDEVVGQWVAIAVPVAIVGGWVPMPALYVGGFLAFRVFDIVKPPPVNWADQKLPGGWGVMIDDVLAGVLAAAVVVALAVMLSV